MLFMIYMIYRFIYEVNDITFWKVNLNIPANCLNLAIFYGLY